MLTRRIIPCLDVMNGRVVKGKNFRNLVDVGDPVELASRYSDEGADEIVLLDISCSLEGRQPFFDVIKRVAKAVAVPLTVGGYCMVDWLTASGSTSAGSRPRTLLARRRTKSCAK